MTTPIQLDLSLPAPPVRDEALLVPVRMVNEWVYCPRLAYLEWVEGQWAANADTAEGSRIHARVDAGGGKLPPADIASELEDPFTARSVEMSAPKLGIIAKMDVVEGEAGILTPIDYKKGKRPHVKAGAYDPERVQLCAQALILEENGYTVGEGFLWFAASRERVPIIFDDELRALTLRSISELRLSAAAKRAPSPLENSPKCPRCSLLPICLPDEVNCISDNTPPRPLNAPADTALPLYVQTPGARVSKSGEELIITAEGQSEQRVSFDDVSELILMGPVGLTTPTAQELLRRGKPIAYFSSGGWFQGATGAEGPRSARARQAQFRLLENDQACLREARALVRAKIRNCRTLLRRNWRGEPGERDIVLAQLRQISENALQAKDKPQLLGQEGQAAALYFRQLDQIFAPALKDAPAFQFDNRNRRPPTDPVNACLSLAYAMLARHWATALQIAGLDPWAGFYHEQRPGRAALALDLMEPYRPIVADSAVITALNQGEVQADDFIYSGPACALKPPGRRRFIAAFERRLDQEITHPLFGYRISMRRTIHVQARLWARFVLGELPTYPHLEPR
jgi:CRISPR-associated endonuclease Cas1/CRISPR-associated protein Cas4